MAKILFTAIVADMRNKLNGTVFSKNRYGAYARTKVTPVNPSTPAQAAARSNFTANSQAWRGLTEAQRQSWIEAAPAFPVFDIFGNQKILSGQALYNKLNGNLLLIGQAPITSAPLPVAVPEVGAIGLTSDVSLGTMDLTAGTAAVPAGFTAVVKATPQYGPGISFVKNKFRFVKTIPAAGSLNPDDIQPEWAGIFGDQVAGQKVSAQLYFISNTTGQAGIPQSAMTVVIP